LSISHLRRRILGHVLPSIAGDTCWPSLELGMPLKVENGYCLHQVGNGGGSNSGKAGSWMQPKKCWSRWHNLDREKRMKSRLKGGEKEGIAQVNRAIASRCRSILQY
jgi:hypothetical protein